MKLTYEQVRKMNNIQIEILEVFITICQSLNLKYYLVHGSLLGAYTRGSLFPFDDDIDVAMPRKYYDILMEKGMQYVPEGYFIQSCKTEAEFPLTFGKIRDNNTAFIQPIFKNLNVNMGIFIDIFPIDFYPECKVKKIALRIEEAVLSARISERLFFDTPQPLWKTISRYISKMFFRSWENAVQRRAELYKKVYNSKKVIVVGGKPSERGIPGEWFSEGVEVSFEGNIVICPKCTDQYLQYVYGNYKEYNPVHKYMSTDETLIVSAAVVDPERSYKEYK